MEEIAKSNPNQRRLIKCPGCGQIKEIHAKGLCYKCYKKQWKSKQIIICKECGRKRPHHSAGYCNSCYNRIKQYDIIKAFNAKKNHGISLERYREITKNCVCCGFTKIVELHHLDGDKTNSSNNNLIGLCPNCHKMIHTFEFFKEIRDILHKKGYNTDKVHPSNYVKVREKKK
jgi:ribosomal protein L37E